MWYRRPLEGSRWTTPEDTPHKENEILLKLGISHLDSLSWIFFSDKRNPDLSESRGVGLEESRDAPRGPTLGTITSGSQHTKCMRRPQRVPEMV